MSKKSEGLGEVDLFGLGDGGELSPVWGVAAGAGLSTVTALAARKTSNPKLQDWSEGIGFAVGALASGAMLLSERTRSAGWVGLVSAFLATGLREIGKRTLGLNGLGAVVIDPTQIVGGGMRGAGLGMVDVQRTAAFAEASEMPTLVGGSLAQASQHVQLVGGPSLNEHSHHWGATHFSH